MVGVKLFWGFEYDVVVVIVVVVRVCCGVWLGIVGYFVICFDFDYYCMYILFGNSCVE